MLSRRRRLRAEEVKKVLASGRTIRGTHLSMKFLSGPSSLRLAVIAPKSVARKAAMRNRLRRAAYDSFRDTLPRNGYAIVFVRSIPHEPLRTVFTQEAAQLVSKI